MESSASAGRVASAVLDPRRWWAPALLCGAFFIVLLDGTITIVGLPSIGAGLHFSEQGLQWVLSAYALSFGGLLLLGGRAADLLGRQRVFTAGVVIFTAASLLCGLAWSPAVLLAASVLQGAGAAIMTPTALSIISATFTEGSERNKALGIWGALGGIGTTTAWLIDGPLVDGPGLAVDLLHQHRRRPRRARAVARAAARQLGPAAPAKLRPRRGADHHRRAGPARLRGRRGTRRRLGRRTDNPAARRFGRAGRRLHADRVAPPRAVVPLRIFRSRTLVGADALTILIGTVAVGMPFVLTLYARQVLGYSALKFGISPVVLALGATAGAIAGQAAVGKVGFRPAAARPAWPS
jgi:MFS family permease